MKRILLVIALVVCTCACGTTGQITPREWSRPDYRQKPAFSWTEAGDYSYLNCMVFQAITDHRGLITEADNHSLRIALLESPNVVLYDRMTFGSSVVYTGYTYQYTDKEGRERTVPIVVRLEDWKNGFKGIKYQD